MDFSIRCCPSQAEFNQALEKIRTFGSQGHEHLKVNQSADGTHHLVTDAKASSSIRGSVVQALFFSTQRFKPQKKRCETVAAALCEFMEKNEAFIPVGLAACRMSFHQFTRFDSLFSEKTAIFTKRWFELQQRVGKACQILERKERLAKLRELGRQNGKAAFLCEGGYQARFCLATLQAFYPQSFLKEFISLGPAPIKASAASLFLDDENNERSEIEFIIPLSQHYPANDVELLIDALYDPEICMELKEVQHLLPLISLSEQLEVEELTSKCKQVCQRLVRQDPSKIIEALTMTVLQVASTRKKNKAFEISLKSKVLEFIEHLLFSTYKSWNELKSSLSIETQYQVFKLFSKVQYDIGLGWCHQFGMGTEINHEAAFAYYQKAAMKGDATAQSNLAECFQRGIGIEMQSRLAFKYFQLAASQGWAIAQNNTGTCYKRGVGIGADPDLAFLHFKQAAKQGYAIAQYNLGLCYENGVSIKQDLEEALAHYQKAADQGLVQAQDRLEALLPIENMSI